MHLENTNERQMKMSPRKAKTRRGVTAVEFALTLPVLILFLFATYELSRANMMIHTAEAAAYEGTRVGIIPGATAQETEQVVRGVLATVGIQDANIEFTPSNFATDSETITVKVSFLFKDNTLIAPFFMGNGAVIEKTCEMMRERL